MEVTQPMQTEKQKSPYSMASNIRFSLRMHWLAKRSTLICCALCILGTVALTWVSMLLPKLVIDELTARVSPMRFMGVIGGATALLMALNCLAKYTSVQAENAVGTIASTQTLVYAITKMVHMDYHLIEAPATKTLLEKAELAMQSNHTYANNIPRTLVRLGINVLSFAVYSGVLLGIHPALLLLVLLSALVHWLFLSAANRYEKAQLELLSKENSKLYYLTTRLSAQNAAKDIRLYNMADLLKGLFAQVEKSAIQIISSTCTKHRNSQWAEALLSLIRDGAAYALLVKLLLDGQLALGDFVFIFAAVGAFAGWVSGILMQASDLIRGSNELSSLRAYLDLPDESNTGAGAPLPTGEMLPPAITLQNVSYTYPEADAPALKNVNLTIRPGERIAIVGANGAGKTTLVKLLCGLYPPKEGAIAFAGVPIPQYNRDAYFSLFSTVFQDIHLLPIDIAGNVSQATPGETDLARVEHALRLSGLWEKVASLPLGVNTLLVREVNDEAAVFSGGETQKLALARALYKDAPVILLDEPTAALDPIAESQVYEQYASLTQGKTSVYISHRLASTRFCDRILFIDDQCIAEEGTHDELMALGGKYAHMFTIQAHYYQKEMEGMILA